MSGAALAGIVLFIAAVTILGDYFLKLASQQTPMLGNRWFLAGAAIYVCSAFGWVFVMRHMKLATIGAVYSVSTVLLLTAMGLLADRSAVGRPRVREPQAWTSADRNGPCDARALFPRFMGARALGPCAGRRIARAAGCQLLADPGDLAEKGAGAVVIRLSSRFARIRPGCPALPPAMPQSSGAHGR